MPHCGSMLSLVVVGSLILAGCSPARRERREPVPKAGGSFRLVFQNPPETLDPQRILFLPDWEVASLLYEGLVGNGTEPGGITPVLAERWEQSEGGKRWVFHLRPDAYFHDDPCFPDGRGRRFSAQDVIYTLERIAKAQTESPNWYLFAGKIEGIDDFHRGQAPSIRGVTALDDNRIEIRLTNPQATFLKTLASQTALIVAREAVEYYGADFAKHPVGTGPFRLVRWKPLEQLLAVRNARYWRSGNHGTRLPYLENIDIRFRVEATESVNLAGFLKGDTYLFQAHRTLYETLQSDPLHAGKFRMVGTLPPAAVRFLGFSLDSDSALARSADLRRALAMSFDREKLAKQSPRIPVILAHALVPPALLPRNVAWHSHDPEGAGKILAAHRQELAASPLILGCNFQAEDMLSLRRSLTGAGVKSTLQIRPVRYYEYIVKERPALFRVSYTPSFLDPEDYYSLFYSKSSPDVNLTGYRNAEYDRALEAARMELDPARRNGLFQRLEDILRRDVPALYVSHGAPTYVLAAPFVEGLQVRFVYLDYTEAWLANGHDTHPESQPPR